MCVERKERKLRGCLAFYVRKMRKLQRGLEVASSEKGAEARDSRWRGVLGI